jgi:hypothetical protein
VILPGRRWITPRRALVAVWLAATAVWAAPDFWRFAVEWRAVSRLAAELAGDLASPESVVDRLTTAVQARVRATANGRFYKARTRPLLRHTAWETWVHGEGLCGEGTRLIVNLLRARGIAASRVSLSNDATGFYHVAVAVHDGRGWRLVDSIGSPPGFREWSRANRLPLHRLVTFESSFGGAPVHRIANPYFTRFSFFNWSRVLPTAVEVNQRVAFPAWVVLVTENPPLTRGLAKVTIAVVALGAVGATMAFRRRARRRPGRPAPAPVHAKGRAT